jgi:hypothetical protein
MDKRLRPETAARWLSALFLAAVQAVASNSNAALPARLILLVDGVSYRDVQALQEGTAFKTVRGKRVPAEAFRQGYFPVSRLISTFPSISDPAWTEILGNEPAPGYQRTYFSAATRSQVSLNGVTSSAEYEKQMTWQMRGGFRRVMSYGSPVRAFGYELNEVMKSFLQADGETTNFYALIHSTDSAQHLWGDINSMLCALDEKLQELRAIYRAREGKELEILILSDHGNNHAGGGTRVAIRRFLARHGYRVTKSPAGPRDIVLPTAGIESWVEIHNADSETINLVHLLSNLAGVDLITARVPDQTHRFMVMNSKKELAMIEWKGNSFKYEMKTGDPLTHWPVVEALANKHELDANGFATAEAWMAETLTHHYPLALERIVRGHTTLALNPASILISLDNAHVHSGWLLKRGITLVKSGGTHGALDHISSTGVLLSSFAPTKDTSTSRAAALFDGFKGRPNCHHDDTAQFAGNQ